MPSKSTVFDIGAYDGTLFLKMGKQLASGIGVDPVDVPWKTQNDKFKKVVGFFPEDIKTTEKFDVITMLATAEHFSSKNLIELPFDCSNVLKPNGLVIMTIPSPFTDHIIGLLQKIRLIDGMSFEDHQGVQPCAVSKIFCEEFFTLKAHKVFQFGLNNLFVFEKKSTN
ncbi:MAG: methyltransferase domain-containing protein [Dehalococcoidia bacterium]|nr:methyltransferase domain-containing protein [Dehalococcoidia bacterium]